MKKRGIIIVTPPWPRSGTSNIIAAQAAAHARRGEDVFLLLEPLGHWNSKYHVVRWRDIRAGMQFSGVTAVDYPRVGPFNLPAQARWFFGERPDAITAVADFAASGRLPKSLHAFIAQHRIEHLRVNHVFGMRLGLQAAELVHRESRKRPSIALDTHDVQTDSYVDGKRVNCISGRIDSRARMLEGELALAARADTLIHLARHDFEFFSRTMPDARHALILPTLHPVTERQLKEGRSFNAPFSMDFVYLGNNHDANLATVRWLLADVLPRLVGRQPKIQIVGSIRSLVKRREPALFRRHKHLFTGEIPSIIAAYRMARAILTPATTGTGSSIKLIEALCAAKPTVSTSMGIRGLPENVERGRDLVVCDDPAEFAAAMMDMLSRQDARSDGNAAIYESCFSNEAYFRSLYRIFH